MVDVMDVLRDMVGVELLSEEEDAVCGGSGSIALAFSVSMR